MACRPPRTVTRTAALLAALAAGGCATVSSSNAPQREDLRNRVELAVKCLDIADFTASVFEQECARALLENRPAMEVAILEYDRNHVKSTVRALALNPEPAFAIVDLYVWSHLGRWACANRVRLNPAMMPANCDRLWGAVVERVDHIAKKVVDPKRLAQVDAIMADFMEHNPDRLTIGTMRLQELVDTRKQRDVAVEDVTPTMFSPISDAARQLEQTRLLGMQLIWLAARMPTTLGEEIETGARVVLESEGMKGTLGRIDSVASKLETAGGSMAKVAQAQERLSNELAGVRASLERISASVDSLGGAREVADRTIAWGAAIAAGTVVLATLGGLVVVRAARRGQGRSGSA